jgi:HSP20 family protein
MDIIKYQPRTMDLFNWNSILDRFFDDGFDRGVRVPAVDVHENDKEYLMEVELPGLTEKDIDVKIENGVMTISSKKEESREEKDEKKGYLRKERREFSFCRSFSLPESTDVDKISATFRNGILNVTIPKAPEAKPKMIEVKVK